MRIGKKLVSRRGETLVGTLVGILIVGLASAVLASMVAASSSMNATAIKADADLYNAVTSAENGTFVALDEDGETAKTVTVKVTLDEGEEPCEFESVLCGDKDLPLWSYRYYKEVTAP